MFKEIAPSVWQRDSGRPGTSVLILGGVHGNERTGVEVINALLELFRSGERSIAKGRLTLALGNLEAIKQNKRCLDGKDLNRLFNPERLTGALDGTDEDTRARILAPYIVEADMTLDIHATNKPSVPFVCSVISSKHEQIYRWFDANIVLTDPNFILAGTPCTTDDYANGCSKIGICYEAGWIGDPSRVEKTIASLLKILGEAGMTDYPSAVKPTALFDRFELIEAIMLTEKGFAFTPEYGASSFQEVKKGECIGYTDQTIPYSANEDSVIVFPKVPELWAIGKPVGYLAKRLTHPLNKNRPNGETFVV